MNLTVVARLDELTKLNKNKQADATSPAIVQAYIDIVNKVHQQDIKIAKALPGGNPTDFPVVTKFSEVTKADHVRVQDFIDTSMKYAQLTDKSSRQRLLASRNPFVLAIGMLDVEKVKQASAFMSTADLKKFEKVFDMIQNQKHWFTSFSSKDKLTMHMIERIQAAKPLSMKLLKANRAKAKATVTTIVRLFPSYCKLVDDRFSSLMPKNLQTGGFTKDMADFYLGFTVLLVVFSPLILVGWLFYQMLLMPYYVVLGIRHY